MSDIHEFPLKHTYTLWWHDDDKKDWSLESYIKVADINSLQQFWSVYNNIQDFTLKHSFFLFRSNIMPVYEDVENVNGGCFTYRISKKNVHKIWEEVSIALLSNTILINDEKSYVTGIVISNKNFNSIIRIWLNNSEIKDDRHFHKFEILDTSLYMYKKHEG